MNRNEIHRHGQEADINHAVGQAGHHAHREGNRVRGNFRRVGADPVQCVLHRVAQQCLHLGAEAGRRVVDQVFKGLLNRVDRVRNHAAALAHQGRRLFQHDGHAPVGESGKDRKHDQHADQCADPPFDSQFFLGKPERGLQCRSQRNRDNERGQLVPDLRNGPAKEDNQQDCPESFHRQPLGRFSLLAHTRPLFLLLPPVRRGSPAGSPICGCRYFTPFSGAFQLFLRRNRLPVIMTRKKTGRLRAPRFRPRLTEISNKITGWNL